MWVGHLAPAFLAKPLFPSISLGSLAFASFLPDFMFFINSILGFEQMRWAPGFNGSFTYDVHWPYSHSLMGVFFTALTAGLIYSAVFNKTLKCSAVVGIMTLSHWFLDVPFHRHNLDVWPGDGASIGWSLLNNSWMTFWTELCVVAPAFLFYMWNTWANRDAPSKHNQLLSFFAAAVFLEHIFFCFGYVPYPNVRFVHTTAFLAQIVFTCLFARFVDRTRHIHLGSKWLGKVETVLHGGLAAASKREPSEAPAAAPAPAPVTG